MISWNLLVKTKSKTALNIQETIYKNKPINLKDPLAVFLNPIIQNINRSIIQNINRSKNTHINLQRIF